jgi:hypothetical protein
VNDPIYTSIDAVPIDSKENGRCSRCGAMVLDYAAHTLHHRELDELFDVVRAWTQALAGIEPPSTPPIGPDQIAKALGA